MNKRRKSWQVNPEKSSVSFEPWLVSFMQDHTALIEEWHQSYSASWVTTTHFCWKKSRIIVESFCFSEVTARWCIPCRESWDRNLVSFFVFLWDKWFIVFWSHLLSWYHDTHDDEKGSTSDPLDDPDESMRDYLARNHQDFKLCKKREERMTGIKEIESRNERESHLRLLEHRH